METIPAIEDTSPIRFPSPAHERGGHTRPTIRDQLEAARFAQQMYHQSEDSEVRGCHPDVGCGDEGDATGR